MLFLFFAKYKTGYDCPLRLFIIAGIDEKIVFFWYSFECLL